MAEKFKTFNKIGLCFSGGGYRATFFSLGVSSYLNSIKYNGESLLKNVSAISTVSGGTLFGMAFAKAVTKEDFDYDLFYQKMYDAFKPENDKLLENAVNKLNTDSIWRGKNRKRRSLINAFALEYKDMDLFSGEFKMFEKIASQKEKPHGYKLEHTCFNATEFSFGLPFRFQNTGLFGNKALNCSEIKPLIDKIQLSDIVASSSCFPLGFEPLVFPDDYILNKGANYEALKKEVDFENGVGVMDGGISDNQGIGSMVNIHKRDPLDLIIVNDVASFKMKPWVKDKKPIGDNTSLKDYLSGLFKHLNVKWIYFFSVIIGLVIIYYNYYRNDTQNITKIWPYFLGAFISYTGFILVLAGSLANKLKDRYLNSLKVIFRKTVPPVLADEVSSFRNLSIDVIKRLITERITSAVTMLNDVFLNEVRRLNYKLFYKDESLVNRRITSRVDKLDGKDTVYKDFKINERIEIKPSDSLMNTVTVAAETPTSLWWDEKDKQLGRMDNLIACGQFTTCYNLMDYILDLPAEHSQKKEVKDLLRDLKRDWANFNNDPLFMVKSNKDSKTTF